MSTYKNLLIDSQVKPKASRLSFGEELLELGKKNSDIVALDADLAKSTQTQIFAKEFPNRFFEMGIAESNMIGVAAGLALSGKIPFAASFAAFLTGRFDQIRMSVSFTGAKVRLMGTHAGVGIGEDGHSQMGLEDLGMMRSLPNMVVFQPADDEDTRQAMRWSLAHQGPMYFRLTRQNLPAIKRKNNAFQLGRWDHLNEGKDIYIIATGGVMSAAIEAADLLREKTSSEIGIVNANWIAPADKELIKQLLAKKVKLIVSVEDHYVVGGLGGAIAEMMSENNHSSQLLRLGVKEFGQSGSPEDNNLYYRLTGSQIAEDVWKKYCENK